jgi:hypothetical protein
MSFLLAIFPLAIASAASWGQDDFFPGTGYSAVPSGSPGDAACPCVDPFSDDYNVTNLGNLLNGTLGVPASYDPGSGGPAECAWLRDASYGQMCYPASYGSQGCKAHDMVDTLECSGCPSLSWTADADTEDCNSCASTWCFVDPRTCRRPNSPSSYFPQATYGTGGPRLSYSYETCGNVDTWEYQRKRLSELKRFEPIRLSYPIVGSGASSGFYVTKPLPGDSDGYEGTGIDGAVTRFVIDALKFYNISFTVQPQSASSRAYGDGVKSTYSGCVHEVVLNRTDLCIGEFWQTKSRLELSAFTRALFADTFHVIAWRKDEGTNPFDWMANVMGAVLQPFDPMLWFLLILTYVAAGLAMWVIEGARNSDDFPDSHGVYRSMCEGIFKSLQSFFGGEDHRFAPRTIPGKFVIFGLSLSSLVLISLYVAKVTTQQIVLARTDRTAATELVKVINSGGKVCALNAQRDELIARIDELEGLDVSMRATGKAGNGTYYFGVSGPKELLWAMDASPAKCGIAIVYEDGWEIMRVGWHSPGSPGFNPSDANEAGSMITGSRSYPGVLGRWNSIGTEHADSHTCRTKEFLRDSSFVFQMDCAMPVRKELQAAFTWLISQRIKKTPFAKVRKASREMHVYTQKDVPTQCPGAGNLLTSSQNKITLQDGGGIVIVSLLITVLCLVFFCLRDRFERQRRLHAVTQAGSTANLAEWLVEPPSFGKRLAGMAFSDASSVTDNPEEDPTSIAFRGDDLNCVEQILSGRRLTTERCHSKFRIESREPLEALCVSDVPTLLRLIRRSAKLGAAEVLGKDPSGTEVAPNQFLPSAWPENQDEKLKRLKRKQGRSFKLAAALNRMSNRMSTGEKKGRSSGVSVEALQEI